MLFLRRTKFEKKHAEGGGGGGGGDYPLPNYDVVAIDDRTVIGSNKVIRSADDGARNLPLLFFLLIENVAARNRFERVLTRLMKFARR